MARVGPAADHGPLDRPDHVGRLDGQRGPGLDPLPDRVRDASRPVSTSGWAWPGRRGPPPARPSPGPVSAKASLRASRTPKNVSPAAAARSDRVDAGLDMTCSGVSTAACGPG